MSRRFLPLLWMFWAAAAVAAPLEFERDARARFRFDGFAGERIGACVTNWLLPAPAANPGMIAMFRVRDRKPAPNLVPWAGEFVGKYLISAIQIERLGHAEMRPVVARIVSELIATQGEDGYLGPFPKEERLLKHWDLWGHYHVLLALLLCHEQTGDVAALNSARRAADLVCDIYLGRGRSILEAGSDEMNLSIVHALGWLYRLTGTERYYRMMREIEREWARAGDFVNRALAGAEFFETPRPRWESLHSIQGILELYRIAGDEKYRRAFEHLWRSIARWDVRNTGGFSSGEQATGNPYTPTAIETCCTIAWMALSADMLQLTGDPTVADALELATWNAWAGAQHPSGRWCTYNTPMDGAREASAHTIVFQSRAGTPELNCCSVNGPRGWGLLADWAVLTNANGIALNWLGPGEFTTTGPAGNAVKLRVSGDYPAGPDVRIKVMAAGASEFTLSVRIPGWVANPAVTMDGKELNRVTSSSYFSMRRRWNNEELKLRLPMALRAQPGARETQGKISIYRGPLLLAWDQRFNLRDEGDIPPVDPTKLNATEMSDAVKPFSPMILLQVTPDLRLADFASAGATGTRYVTWLPATHSPPAPVFTRTPRDGAIVPPGQTRFHWTAAGSGTRQTVQFSASSRFEAILHEIPAANRQVLADPGAFAANEGWTYWRVVTENQFGKSVPPGPPARFRFDPQLPRRDETLAARRTVGADGAVVRAALLGKPEPTVGRWIASTNWAGSTADESVRLNGTDQRLLYEVGEWPEEAYSVSLSFRIERFPEGRIGQLFSAWHAPMDDPLRLTVSDGRLFARIEAGANYSTPGVAVEKGKWHRVAAVRDGGQLILYLDGKEQGRAAVPVFAGSRARDFALGGNPHYSGNEHLEASVRDLVFYDRAVPPADGTKEP